MGKRRAYDDEWELHKDVIYDLYVNEGRTLKEVIELMSQRHGYKRTKSQYELVLKKWDIKKKNRKEDWVFITSRIKEREAQGRESAVEIRNKLVPTSKVKNKISRYEYHSTTFEYFASRLNNAERDKTPPHIRVYTPHCPSSPIVGAEHHQGFSPPLNSIVPISRDLFFDWTELTPWYQFMCFIRTLDITSSLPLLILPWSSEDFSSLEFTQPARQRETLILRGSLKMAIQDWIDDIMTAPLLNFGVEVPAIYSNLRPYLPPTRGGSSDINVQKVWDLSQRTTQLEFLKLAVYFISNNFDIDRSTSVMASLAQDKRNLSLLQCLLDRKLPMVEAFAEKLLIPAAQCGNLPLVAMLIEHEVDINTEYYPFRQSALSCAIQSSDEGLVTYLLNHGAKANRRVFQEYVYVYNSLLDLAVECSNYNIVKDILTPRPQFDSRCPEISIYTLRSATLRGDFDIFQYLVDQNPALLDTMKSKPWILYEAAAIQEDLSIFQYLLNNNVDVTKMDDNGKGSALAAACFTTNMPLIRHLIELGVDVNSVALGDSCRQNSFDDADTLERNFPRGIRDKSALQIAVENDQLSLVHFLLSKRADANQCCGAYPLQIAVCKGNDSLVGLLLDAGAKVHPRTKISGNYEIWEKGLFDPRLSFRTDYPAIQIALEKGYLKIFHALRARKATIPRRSSNVDVRNEEWNPLESAMVGGCRELVLEVIKDTGSSEWGTPECLAMCVQKFSYGYALELIDIGLFTRELYDLVILCQAVYEGDEQLVETLLSKSQLENRGILLGYGAVGLTLAVKLRKEGMISRFLKAGIKPHELVPVTIQGILEHPPGRVKCALQEAFALLDIKETELSDSLEMAMRLLNSYGSKLQEIDYVLQNRGILLAFREALATGRLDAVKMILSTGINVKEIDRRVGVDRIDNRKLSSLQYLYYSRSRLENETSHVAKVLLEHGADPDPSKTGFFELDTPLQLAAMYDSAPLIKLLLGYEANVNAKANLCRSATALQFAAINGNFEILNMLLEAGADINAPPGGYKGRSAIEGASEWGRIDMVQYLLEAGSDVKGRTNQNYRRSIYRAWENGHRTLVRMIQNWKTERYGARDCEEIHIILESMTRDELDFADAGAKKIYEECKREERGLVEVDQLIEG
ncbi:ankyrin [Lojkania enalia]|uniref:Ankyrin n=1 Tax=Lojkania enalia TaxID=147567 RepID=A0A9P4N344_9PLEO|nr:ankyrin [Didymosphaeria enalia]